MKEKSQEIEPLTIKERKAWLETINENARYRGALEIIANASGRPIRGEMIEIAKQALSSDPQEQGKE